MSQQVILIVDDDKDIVKLLEVYLSDERYKVIKTYNGEDAVRMMDLEDISLVILDIMMPNIDGIEVCRRIREKSNIPIIMLSAKSTDVDKVIGLSTGADDYLVKPFSHIEFIARVKAQLRRYTYLNKYIHIPNEDLIDIKGLQIDSRSRNVTLYGKNVKLTKTEYEILLLMAKNLNRVFTLEEIFEKVWGEKYFDGNNTVMVHLARLREKIKDTTREDKIIKNVWGVGYKIES